MTMIDSIDYKTYNILKTLNSHKFSCVHLVNDESNNKFILKSFQKEIKDHFIYDENKDEFLPRELFYMNKLSNKVYVPTLLNYHDGLKWSTVVMEFLDKGWTDLFYFVFDYNDEIVIKIIMRNLITICHDMAKDGFYHRDIKPENVMVNRSTLEVKIIDFEDIYFDKSPEPMSKTTAGTVGYKSPESYLKELTKLKPSIVFSIGCVAYSCIELQETYRNEEENINCKPLLFRKCSTSAAYFINGCTKKDSEKRINFHDLLKHRWFCP